MQPSLRRVEEGAHTRLAELHVGDQQKLCRFHGNVCKRYMRRASGDAGGHLHRERNIATRRLPERGCTGEPLTALLSRCSSSTFHVPDAALYAKGASWKEILTRSSAYMELAS